ncbi:glycosyltransferase [Flavobacterium gyeonganense]|uniref:Glycosyltransferase n=1 Tax=Flavobacterium gyeonganense TaxID=1310418 RepID=A0ABV5HGD1_9FLAO|nr:glycosyltransferase [Flavobacterium gyeonganense]
MTRPAVIVVTFNRPNSLKRVLSSLRKAEYPENENINLIISIDYQDSDNHTEVVKIADEFRWPFGEKKIIEHKENLGLRKHVISCGNLVNVYDSIIMLEDDIYVSPKYYSYSFNSLAFYGDKDYIGGISLYKHEKNPNNNRPFQPLHNNFDVFFLQFAQSWGQCWSKSMWLDFMKWYENRLEWNKDERVDLPAFVLGWPESSWLKYYIKYLSETNKYFVYPYFSFSTNFHDVGTHNNDDVNNSCQVHLDMFSKNMDRFPKIHEAICYDGFFELQNIQNYISISDLKWENDVCVDLYATKKNLKNNKYWLTTASLQYKIVESYGLNLRPHDANVIAQNQGNQIFLYDISISQNNKINSNVDLIINYDHNITSLNKLFVLVKMKLLKRLKSKINGRKG